MRIVIYLKIVTSLLFICNLGYGQTLIKNINSEAIHLKHKLNNNKDSLILESTKLIEEVVFYSDLASTRYPVHDLKANLSLDKLTIGENTVMVKERGDYIIFNIIMDTPINVKKKEIVMTSVEIEVDIALRTKKREIVMTSFDNDCPDGITIIPYRLSNRNNIPKCSKFQSRADYRATHLAPNGTRYKINNP